MERLTDKELSAIFNKPLKNLLDVMNLQRATAQAQLEKDSADLKAQLTDKAPEPAEDMVEAVAAGEHQQWVFWTSYILNNQTPENVERWRQQILTPYSELSEQEKESDRYWARKILKIYQAANRAKGLNEITNPVPGSSGRYNKESGNRARQCE